MGEALGGEGGMTQLSTISFSAFSKLETGVVKSKLNTNNARSTNSRFSNSVDISTNERSQTQISISQNVWTNKSTDMRKRKGDWREDNPGQRNPKHRRFNSDFD